MTDEVTVEEIAKILVDKNQPIEKKVRYLFMAKHIPTEEAVNALVPVLYDSSFLLAHETAYVLGQMQHKSAIPHLVKVLQDTSANDVIRHEAAEALAAIGEPESLKVLEQYLNDEYSCVRDTCYLALKSLEAKCSDTEKKKKTNQIYQTVDPVAGIPSDLLKLSTAEIRDILLNEKTELQLRYQALFALRDRHNDAKAHDAIIESLKDTKSALFRHEVAFVLGQIQHPASLKPLVAALKAEEEHPMVRHEAAVAIGSVLAVNRDSADSNLALQTLKEYSTNPCRMVAESCLVALDTIGNKELF